MRSALDHLLPSCDLSAVDKLIYSLSMKESEWQMYGVSEWDVHKLNAAMMEMIREDCAQTAERIATGSFYRWQEENKQLLQQFSELSMELCYLYIGYYYSTLAEQNMAYKSHGVGDEGGSRSAQGLTGKDFEDYLTDTLGGDGSFSVGGKS